MNIGDKVIRIYRDGRQRPAIITALASVINGKAYAAVIAFTDGLKPATQSVKLTDLAVQP